VFILNVFNKKKEPLQGNFFIANSFIFAVIQSKNSKKEATTTYIQ